MDMMSIDLTGTVPVVSSGVWVLIWLALVILFVIIELFSLGLTSVWFAAGALASALTALAGGPLWLQVVIFIVVSAALLATTRSFAKRHLDNKIVKTNVEGLIGQTSVVIETIDNAAATGKIKIGDVEWTARACNHDQVIDKDTTVVIREIQGVKCMVEPLEKDGTFAV